MVDFVAWHGKTLLEHMTLRDSAASEGYRFLSLSVYGTPAQPFYAAVMIRRPILVAQRDWPQLSADQFQQIFDDEASRGFGPVIIAATGPASSPLFAAVFEPQDPIPLTRHLLTSGSDTDPGTIQGMNAQAKSQGLILRWAAAYGDAGNPGVAGIWVPNRGNTHWSVDVIENSPPASGYVYQDYFDAETSGWCRPAFVTLNTGDLYLPLFVDDLLIGHWHARHGLSPYDYQVEFDTWTRRGYFPICVGAAGPDASSAKFAALFATSEHRVAKVFSATGPVANAGIDAVVEQVMQESGVRHASLAIVHGTSLVYARGYTLAEPSWPIAHPTTRFRMASVSKTPTALAIYQLIEEGLLNLSDRLQDILALQAIGGGPPSDARFNSITIQHLLEHTSGLNPDDFANGVAVRDAFNAAFQPATLPASAEMTDSFIASLNLASDPGSTQVYNNCGYYLLGRVVAKLRNTARPIDAYQQYLFSPLSITRIRPARSLLADQPAHEARYQNPDLIVYPSQMSQEQPFVPTLYGSLQLEILEGSGGLTGAAPDIARLIAIVMSQQDNPALTRATLTSMLSAGAALSAAGMDRAGYGFDRLVDHGNGRFYGQKGGLLDSSSNWIQFDDDWGFAIQWGGIPPSQLNIYPDFPALMNIARSVSWGATDLFPEFGMPSL